MKSVVINNSKRQRGLSPSSPTINAFARRLREWRKAQGLPLKHVAREVGVSVSIVSEWEHGHRFPSASNLEALARYTGFSVCCLLYHGRSHCPHSQASLK